jgi:hypothetical protein
MAKLTVQQISRKAKQIRHKGEKWLHAIRRASKMLKGERSVKRKVAATKFIERGETKRTKAKVYRRVRTRKGNFKSLKRIVGINKHPFTLATLRKAYPDSKLGYREKVILFGDNAKIRLVQPGVFAVKSKQGEFWFTFKHPHHNDYSVVN